jgi:hypothetical protein
VKNMGRYLLRFPIRRGKAALYASTVRRPDEDVQCPPCARYQCPMSERAIDNAGGKRNGAS